MVDVLCCSLGCVILLWLNNYREAKDNAKWGDETTRKLLATETDLKRSREEEAMLRKLLAETNERETTTRKDLTARITTLAERRAVLETLLVKRVKELESLEGILAELRKDHRALKTDLDSKTTQSQDRQKKIDDLLKELARLNDRKSDVEKILALRDKSLEELEKKLGLLGKRSTTLEEDLAASKLLAETKQKNIDELQKKSDEVARKLLAAETTIKQLEATAALLPKFKDELKDTRQRLLDEETRTRLLKADLTKRLEETAKVGKELETLLLAKRALERKMEGISRDLIDALAYKERATEAVKKRDELQAELGVKGKDLNRVLELLERLEGDKKRLLEDATRVKAIMEQRFAGVALTGKKVVFLVDTSGSMELVDENTPALHKWSGVRDTLVQLMKSMPELDKFQIITFAEELSYPLGKQGEWIDYDPKTTPQKIYEAMTRIKPSGGTNLHKPFEAALGMRRAGLDTVYLFSDGLPSDGDGLTGEQDRRIKDPTERSIILSRHLRKKLKDDWNRKVDGLEKVRINSIGFFYESPDVGAFLWALSREHDGSFVGMSKP
jgi:hypothetical protein